LVLCFVCQELPRQIYDSPTIEAAVKIEIFVGRADSGGPSQEQLAVASGLHPKLGQPLGKSRRPDRWPGRQLNGRGLGRYGVRCGESIAATVAMLTG